MATKDDLGRWGEELAARHLTERGYRVLDRNWRCPSGEIDIVAAQGGALVVVEVKTRRSVNFGHPFEAVTPTKLGRLHRLGLAWRSAHPGRHGVLRIDVVSVVGAPDAFDPRIEVFAGVRG